MLEKVENVVSTLLRDSLLLTAICPDEAKVVLRAWSSFILNSKTKSLGEGNKEVISEVLNMLEGVLGLVQRVNHKISSYSKSGIYGYVGTNNIIQSVVKTFVEKLVLSPPQELHAWR